MAPWRQASSSVITGCPRARGMTPGIFALVNALLRGHISDVL
jgi:hypothetical protein